ncbi:protein transport protein SEC16B homolog isoform X2 [Henckelia pumila]|uniref:protein transport protein SEC16B homolog isoform X2 n=1 Tax=Henckelia pumila TaxID=405737 RepID=UPI003C6DE00B
MASNPPFLVEDNTDEDFFDKLVNDDDDVDFGITSTSADRVLSDGNESDESKAFSNLNINEFDNSCDVRHDNASNSISNNVDNLISEIKTAKQIEDEGAVEYSRNPLVSENSFEFGNLIGEPKTEDEITEVLSDTTFMSKSSGERLSDATVVSKSSGESGAPGVKEMDWSAFHSDSNKNDGDGFGFGSYSDFFTELGGDNAGDAWGNVGDNLDPGPNVTIGNDKSFHMEDSNSYGQYNEENDFSISANQSTDVQDLNSSQHWESMYPGWKYEPSTGQWYQVDGYDTGASAQAHVDSNLSSTWGLSNAKAEISYFQQTAQSVAGTVPESGKIENVTDWNQASQVSDAKETTSNWNQVSQVSSDTSGVSYPASQDNNGYPPHMVFDPQYPDWYYDTIAQGWFPLESYTASTQSSTKVQDQMNQDGYAVTNTFSQNNDQRMYSTHSQGNNYQDQAFGGQGQEHSWTGSGSFSDYNQQSSKMWQPETVSNIGATSQYGNEQMTNSYTQNLSQVAHGSPQNSFNHGVTGSYYENGAQGPNDFSMGFGSQGFVAGRNLSQQFNDSRINQHSQNGAPSDFTMNQNSINFSQQMIQGTQTSYAPAAGRSSAGRPPHALVTFGFGGKLIVMKDNSSTGNFSYGSQNTTTGSISVLSLQEVVNENNASNNGMGVCYYFQALCRQATPGPLTGGNVGIKELNKWVDERIANPESADMDYRKAENLRLLLSLLKLGCQYYGKLRSPYGTDAVSKESDGPESAVAKLFASAKRNDMQRSQYGAVAQCLQQMPSEGQMQATAAEVQSLLVFGRKKEALQCAKEGQLWGPALVLAAQLGDQFYGETVKQMALQQLVAGSPLRTLCLLIAGQPADVFSADTTAISSMAGVANLPQQPPQFLANGMLDDWEDNLAMITANRTKDDELVLIHLGDCLWKERSDIIAAHICYLVAEASFEPYSDSARLCLVGADHWKFPRTYASPEAIQRTEVYEYSKTLGNSQFVLLPFQPYKLVYAYMLTEVGRISDALKYCQAVLKSLKTGRNPEVETLRHLVSSLEERIKAHQEGGFSTNLAPKKLVGKLLNLFDSTAHRVVGGLPPPAPTAGGSIQGNMNYHQTIGPRVSTSQSTLAMSSLVPSQSMEPISEWAADSNRMSMHARSVSEPDFGRSPRQAQSLKEENSAGEQEKVSAIGRRSRFGSFGFGTQLLQKTVGLVLNRQGRQAKLGDTNKFYYDDKLKRWVEEGAAPPAEEETLPPPPTTAIFQNGTSDYNLKTALQNEISHVNRNPEHGNTSPPDNSSGIPPLPPTSNQYSARGRMGVRSRYVDTFNQGGGNTGNSFQAPAVPSVKPASSPNPKFFVPTPVTSFDPSVDAPVNGMQDNSSTHEHPSTSPSSDTFHSPAPPPSSMNIPRFASMNNISNNGTSDYGSFSTPSRRTASWSGRLNDSFSPPYRPEVKPQVKPLAEVLGIDPSSFMPSDPPIVHSSKHGGNFGDDLHEVEL